MRASFRVRVRVGVWIRSARFRVRCRVRLTVGLRGQSHSKTPV